MEKIIEILRDIDDSIEWEKEQGLIDRRLLDSFGVISLVSVLEDCFMVEIEAGEMVPENFNSVEAIYEMIQRLQEK